jgi:hypothetical protein
MDCTDEWEFIDVAIDSGSPFNTGSRDQPILDIIPSLPNVEAMAVLSVNLPFTYTVIDATCNTFTFQTPDTPNTVYTIYLVPGTYTLTDFVTMLNNVLQVQYSSNAPQNGGVSAAGGAGTWADVYTAYRLTAFVYTPSSTLNFYTDTTGSEEASVDFILNFSTTATAYASMGFAINTSYDATSATIYVDSNSNVTKTVYYIESPYTINMSGPAFIYLISDLAQMVKDGVVRTERNTDSILQIVPVNNNYKGTISYINPKPEKIMFSKTTVNRVQCSLVLGHRTSYCPGNDYSYYNNGVPSTVNYLSLNGQAFQTVIRFYKRKDTKIDYTMVGGDKFAHAEAQQTSAVNPSLESFNVSATKPRKRDRMGVQMPPLNQDRITSFPQRAPGSRVAPPNYRRMFPAITSTGRR